MAALHAFVSFGQGGRATTPATGSLNSRLAELGAKCPGPYQWFDAAKIAAAIRRLPEDDLVVIGGTSLGANEAPAIAELVAPRPVAYIFGIQPSWYGRHNLIPSNVARARTWRNPWWFPVSVGFGVYSWQRKPSNTSTRLEVENTYAAHPGDWVDAIQDAILSDVRALIAKL